MEALFLHTPCPVEACCSTRVGLLFSKSFSLSYESTFQHVKPAVWLTLVTQINIQYKVQTKSYWTIRCSFQPSSSLTQQRSPCSVAAGTQSIWYWVSLTRDFRDYLGAGWPAPYSVQELSASVLSNWNARNHFLSSDLWLSWLLRCIYSKCVKMAPWTHHCYNHS